MAVLPSLPGKPLPILSYPVTCHPLPLFCHVIMLISMLDGELCEYGRGKIPGTEEQRLSTYWTQDG